MTKLTNLQNLIFRTGALLMIAGAALFLFLQEVACLLYIGGVLMFVAMQLQATYDGNDIVVMRLRRQQLIGAFLFVLSAASMSVQTFYQYNAVQYNEWVICLLVGAVLQLYTAFRIPQAMKLLFFLPLLMSCSSQYIVDGTTTVHGMEGKVLYLKVFDNKDLKNIDSCYVTHGKFQFRGSVDTTMMANLFLGEQSLMPIVLEGQNIVLKINEISQSVTGSPLNDSLYSFIQSKNQIENQLAELPRLEGRMVMDGIEHDEVIARLAARERILNRQNDQLVTGFIKRNYTNVLGPGVFMIMTSGYAYPVLTPQIEELLVGAPSYFLNHPYVSEYLRVAQENMEKLQQQ